MGCRLNAAEIEGLARAVSGAGHEVVWDPAEADAIVLNSCAVTARAVHKSRQRLRALHRANPGADLAVTGCWATAAPDLVSGVEGVRWALPNEEKAMTVAQVLSSVHGDSALPELRGMAPWAPGRWGHTRAFLGVQDGCDHTCTYCVTRILRGPGRSLPFADALTAAKDRAASGAQELVLTGVSLGAYGRDLGLEDGLARLVTAILAETDLPRLRLSSIEPWDISPTLLALWQDPRLCRQLHIPLQSGSDAVLRRMGRQITVGEYRRLVVDARAVSPDIAITTDILVGFPGETAEAFAETVRFIGDVGFARLHVFPYSERPGTAAVRLPDRVPAAERRARGREVRALGEALGAAYRARFVGQILPVLWEPQTLAGEWVGLTDTYLEVRTRDARALYNTITPTRICDGEGGALTGEVVLG
ncbi:MAG: MiaB/RimO family radical SAM methylthiotransferase [Anaerolineae bacterium]|jgi:threonylcarbamoyladenosine tRNA methylthiotransferase MtaB|nr:MiaB/RimO family radical SAM methylthiotransferase [Anaerolineae bacterium]